MPTYIIGVDCATQPKKVGLALAALEDNTCRILKARCCSKTEGAVSLVAGWHRETPVSLLALDAPLGWPVEMGSALADHQAGEPIPVEANQLFRRQTDREIERRLQKRPLEVGANLIARTAKAALEFLRELREETGESIPLAWDMSVPLQLSAIEVYPAATWLTLNFTNGTAPQLSADAPQMLQMLQRVSALVDVSAISKDAEQSQHILDAILCVMGGVDFIERRCVVPLDLYPARKEGWIWAGWARGSNAMAWSQRKDQQCES